MDHSHFAWTEIILRLGAAVLAGGAIGLDRECCARPLDSRRICCSPLASAMLSVMALDLYFAEIDLGSGTSPDATRILQGIITGMSFLGAGRLFAGSIRSTA